MKKKTDSQPIQVISRAASILRVLGEDTGGLSLGQIAGRVNLPRSTVQRIIAALSSEHLVSVGQRAGRIQLGPAIRHLAGQSRLSDPEILTTALAAISNRTGETVDLAILDGNAMLFIDQIVGRHRLRAVSETGEHFPLTSTANGKASLALLPRETALNLARAELSETGKLQTAKLDHLLEELEGITQTGLAFDRGEHTEGISAAGFAITDSNGRIYAISIPVPSTRFTARQTLITAVLLEWRQRLNNQMK
jgi:DNA-binding IclR family transcriptional regulator